MLRLVVDAAHPDPDAIERAAEILRRGGVAAIPTDTLYGLAADPFHDRAVDRVFAVKGRMADQALPLVAGDTSQVRTWLGALSDTGERLSKQFWPGPLTLVVRAPARLAKAVVAGRATVGVRVPAHAVTRALCLAFGCPVTATSANRSGEPPTEHPDVVAAGLGEHLDALVDAGATPGGPPSTIVELVNDDVRLVREGAISWNDVVTCVRRG